MDGFNKWTFSTVQLWGESPQGNWTLEVLSDDGSLSKYLIFFLLGGSKILEIILIQP
jgi:subtilisin-like proprotein convertase family protein